MQRSKKIKKTQTIGEDKQVSRAQAKKLAGQLHYTEKSPLIALPKTTHRHATIL